MAKRILLQKRWWGGLSDDEKDGTENSFFFGKSLDFRSEPSKLKVLPKTTKESGANVDDLIKWFENVNTDIYGVGDNGGFYRRQSNGTWTALTDLTSASGNGLAYWKYDDYIYAPKDSVIARYGPVGGTPTLTQDYFTDGTIDLDQFLDTSGSTYAVPTAISETATNRQTFIPTRDPQRRLQINVSVVGATADWTVTVHDAGNREIATKTNLNAAMGTGDQNFDFATPWRPILGATYHFHITVTNTTSTPAVVATTSGDLETADFHTFYQILVTDELYHPAKPFLDFMAIGNGQYVATYNGFPKELGTTVYDPHRLHLFKGWKARDLEKVGEYLAIVAWQGDTVTDYDQGMIYLWDGIANSPNFTIETEEGTICAAASYKKQLFYLTSAGNLYRYIVETEELKRFPKMTQQTFVDVFPGAFAAWRGMPHIGFAGDSDSTTIEKGVYSYGKLDRKYPEALNFDYPISSGTTTGTGLDIGALAKKGNALLVAWKNGLTYGVDVVSSTANPFTTALYESLIFDDKRPDKQKLALLVKVRHAVLVTNQSVEIEYKIDRATSWTSLKTNSTAGTKETFENFNPNNSRFYEIQFRVTLTSTGADDPETYSFSFEYDDLAEEEALAT